jgi:hypothetical protein
MIADPQPGETVDERFEILELIRDGLVLACRRIRRDRA